MFSYSFNTILCPKTNFPFDVANMQLTDFHKVFEDEISQFQANRNSDVQRLTLVRQFKEAVWVCFLSLLVGLKILTPTPLLPNFLCFILQLNLNTSIKLIFLFLFWPVLSKHPYFVCLKVVWNFILFFKYFVYGFMQWVITNNGIKDCETYHSSRVFSLPLSVGSDWRK